MAEAGQCDDKQLLGFISKTEQALSVPAYANFCVTSLTMLSLAIYAFSNYNPVVSFTFSAIALFVTTLGFLLSKKMMDARVSIMSEIQSGKQIDPAR